MDTQLCQTFVYKFSVQSQNDMSIQSYITIHTCKVCSVIFAPWVISGHLEPLSEMCDALLLVATVAYLAQIREIPNSEMQVMWHTCGQVTR